MHARLLAHLLVAASLIPQVRAADQTVLGSVLIVRNPSTPEKRRIVVRAREKEADDTLVGDPVADGASVTITANGATSSSGTYQMPAGTSSRRSKPFWIGDPVHGFQYNDPDGDNGPVRRAQIRSKRGVFQIKINVDARLGTVAVVPPDTGSDGCVLFAIAGRDSYSVEFASGKVTNTAILFKVAKPTREGSCLPTSTTTSTSTTTTTQPAPPYRTPPGAAPLRYRDMVFGAVTTTPDLTYGSAVNASGQTVTLKLDIYEPTGDTATERPAIVWVHGGSFCCGNKTSAELIDEANVFAKKGYLNASINYRLEPGGCSASSPTTTCVTAILEAREDAQTAVRFLRSNASVYGIDASRIAIGGSSAGAITALNVGFRSSEDPDAAVGGAVSLSGAEILTAIGPGDAPSLLFHGTADSLVPYQWAVDTVNAATAAGLDSFLTTWDGDGHVPYVQHRAEILDQTTNFLYWELDLAHAGP